MANAYAIKDARLYIEGLEHPIGPMEGYHKEAMCRLGQFHMEGRMRPRYVSNKLRLEFGWQLPSNAKLARKRRRIERLIAQRVGRR